MPRKRAMTDTDPDAPRLEDIEQFGDATRSCPKCGVALHDDVDICYKCGFAIGASAPTDQPKPWVLVIVVLVVLAILLPFIMRVF